MVIVREASSPVKRTIVSAAPGFGVIAGDHEKKPINTAKLLNLGLALRQGFARIPTASPRNLQSGPP
jgi:hypothetical protein